MIDMEDIFKVYLTEEQYNELFDMKRPLAAATLLSCPNLASSRMLRDHLRKMADAEPRNQYVQDVMERWDEKSLVPELLAASAYWTLKGGRESREPLKEIQAALKAIGGLKWQPKTCPLCE